MENPVELIGSIINMDDFLNFLIQLALDAKLLIGKSGLANNCKNIIYGKNL